MRRVELKAKPCCASTALMIHAFQYYHLRRPWSTQGLLTLMTIELRLCVRGGFFDRTILTNTWPDDLPIIARPNPTLDYLVYRRQFYEANVSMEIPEGMGYLVAEPDHPAVLVLYKPQNSEVCCISIYSFTQPRIYNLSFSLVVKQTG